jgi:four helix bundle protein
LGATRFQDLEAWRSARLLTRQVYELTGTGPLARDFGLRDQMQRASVSVMSNIAEGFDSRTRRLFREFLGRAKASSGELQAQLYVALDVGYISSNQFDELSRLSDRCSRQLRRLIEYLDSLEPGTRNPEPGTRNQEPGTRNPEPGTRNPEPSRR